MKCSVYDTENLLVETLLDELFGEVTPWGAVTLQREFDYARGRTDVIALTEDGSVVAFEAKLSRWKIALHQAYRNRCYADASYIVVPKAVAFQAARFPHEFTRRGVGLCYIDEEEGLVVLRESGSSETLQPWLRTLALERIAQASAE